MNQTNEVNQTNQNKNPVLEWLNTIPSYFEKEINEGKDETRIFLKKNPPEGRKTKLVVRIIVKWSEERKRWGTTIQTGGYNPRSKKDEKHYFPNPEDIKWFLGVNLERIEKTYDALIARVTEDDEEEEFMDDEEATNSSGG